MVASYPCVIRRSVRIVVSYKLRAGLWCQLSIAQIESGASSLHCRLDRPDQIWPTRRRSNARAHSRAVQSEGQLVGQRREVPARLGGEGCE